MDHSFSTTIKITLQIFEGAQIVGRNRKMLLGKNFENFPIKK